MLGTTAPPGTGAGVTARAEAGVRLPGWVQVAAGLLLLANVVTLLLGTAAVGVSWDEPTHVTRLSTYQETGWYLRADQMDGDRPAEDVRGLGVYAPATALLGHVTAVVLGSEDWGRPSTSAEAYAHRHVAVALLGIVGLLAVALLVRLLVGSWRWGLLGAATLSALPVWTGHAMFNVKDVPVATGHTLVTCGAVALASTRLVGSPRRQRAAVAALSLGTVVTVGTRPGMAVAVGASVLAAVGLGAWLDSRSGAAGASLRRLLLAVAGLGSAYAVLLVMYPALFGRADLLVGAVLDSGEYPWDGVILTAGTLVTMPPPPSYLPLWFLAQTPLVVLVLAVVGLLAPAVLVTRGVRRSDPVECGLGAGLGLVGLQALLLPVAGVLTSAVLYDATRQVLFVQPALAVAATGATWLIARRLARRRVASAALFAVLVIGLVVPTATHIRLFPYDYAWFNVAAASRPIDGAWMTEYWRVSARELVAHTPAGGEASCRTGFPPRGLVACETQPQFTPYWSTRATQTDAPPLGPDEYAVAQVNRLGTTVPEGCTPVHLVTRPLFGQDVLMAAVSRCPAPDPASPPGTAP